MGTVEKRDKHKKRRFVSPEEKLERLYTPQWSLSHRSISIMQMHLRQEVWMR